MKIGIFTDSHYSSHAVTCEKRFNSRSLEKLREAYAYFMENGCALVICLGDLIDKEDSHQLEVSNLRRAAQVLRQLPTVCVMGNHDAFSFEREEFYAILGGCEPRDLCIGEHTLVFLDACFYRTGEAYAPGGTDWTDTFLPDTDALKQRLRSAKGNVCVFIHQSIDPAIREDHRLHNAAQVIRILEESAKVKTVYQGHYHPGAETVHNGISYITFPAMCENEGARYILQLD